MKEFPGSAPKIGVPSLTRKVGSHKVKCSYGNGKVLVKLYQHKPSSTQPVYLSSYLALAHDLFISTKRVLSVAVSLNFFLCKNIINEKPCDLDINMSKDMN